MKIFSMKNVRYFITIIDYQFNIANNLPHQFLSRGKLLFVKCVA